MENETENKITEDSPKVQPVKKDYILSVSILISAVIFVGAWVYTTGLKSDAPRKEMTAANLNDLALTLEEKVLPSEGVVLPVRWGDLGIKLASAGVIDQQKFDSMYASRGGISETNRRLLEKSRQWEYKNNFGKFRISS